MRRVIHAKLTPPSLQGHVIERPRVEAHLAGLLASHPVVWVCATAGAGKTTAVVRAAARDARELRWLTVDATDRAPGRLLTYLEAAVGPPTATAGSLVEDLLDERLPHAEVAGLLAETLTDEPAVVVLDELEHLAHSDAALAVIGSFVRYAPDGVTVVLVSREEIDIPAGTASAARVGEAALAFTEGEAEAALTVAGHADADAASVLEATGGWVAGVMFEAWRSDAHVLGSGGESDPFYGYLSHEILDRLSGGEREFLVRASLVDEITPEVAAAVGTDDAPALMASLRDKHLPAVWSADGVSLRLHTRFREYLRELLRRRGVSAIGPLRRRVARMWVEQGHDEEAVEELLLAGAEQDAVAPAERAVPQLIQRLDYEHADRWLAAFARAGVELTPPLWRAALMSATGQWQFPRGAAIADRLRSPEGAPVLAGLGWEMVALLAWCYHHVARHDDVHALIGEHREMPELEVAERIFDAVCAADVHWLPPSTVAGPLDVVWIRAHFVRGEMAQVRELASSRWSASLSVPFTVSRLRASGRTSEALAVYEASAASGSTDVWLHAIAYPEILIDLGRTEEALAALVEGRKLIDRTGSRMLALLNEVLRAKHAIRLRGDPALALEILEPLGAAPGAEGFGFLAEVAECWRGRALLMLERDDEALSELERAVEHMQRGERGLELPTAAVYLAEARWRAGDEEGSDAAAELALAGCACLGSQHTLLQALTEHPAVLTRCMDAESRADSAWHAVGRRLMHQRDRHDLPPGRHIELQEFGEVRLLVDGLEVRPRIAKSFELLAHLVDRPGRRARRIDLLDALFDGRDDTAARTYLRQAILHLREALPRPDALSVDKLTVSLHPDVVLSSQAQRFDILLAEAGRLLGEGQIDALEAALALYDGGEFFRGRSSTWIDARRERLATCAAEARMTLAETHLRAGEHASAARHAEGAVRADPYRERGWQILMQIAAAVGDHDAVIGAYRECRTSLADVGIEPSPETQALVDRLRSART